MASLRAVVPPLTTVAALRSEAARLRGEGLPHRLRLAPRPLPSPRRPATLRTARPATGVAHVEPPDLDPSSVGLLLTDAATVALGSVLAGHRALVAAEVDVEHGATPTDLAALRSAVRVLTEQVDRTRDEVASGWRGLDTLLAGAPTTWPDELLGVLGEVWATLSGRPELVRAVQRAWEEVALALEDRATRLRDRHDGPAPDVRGVLADVLLAHASLCREVGGLCLRVAAEVQATRERVEGWLGAPGARVATTATAGPVTAGTTAATTARLLGAGLWAGRLEALADLLEELVLAGTAGLGRLDAVGLAMTRAAALVRGAGDPGASGTTAPGSPSAAAAGPEPIALDHAVACVQQHWSAAASGGDPVPLPAGWRRVDPREVGLDPALLSDERSGFAAAVFAGETWVVSFAGTDFSGDLVADFLVEDLLGGLALSPQVADVLALVDAVHGTGLRDAVVWSGHSLGGRLAAVASLASGDTAVTFNAAGVSTATVGYVAARQGVLAEDLLERCRGGVVRAYRTEGDVVTGLQERLPTAPLLPDAPGRPLLLGRSVDALVEGHLMAHVVREWVRAHGRLLGG